MVGRCRREFPNTPLANRLKSFNCGFLLRPHVEISEFSETIMENAKYIKENLDIFDVEAIQRFLGKTDNILESLQRVNQKDKSGSGKTISSYGIWNIYIVSFRDSVCI